MIISRIAIRRPVTTLMLLGALVVFGFVSFRKLSIEQYPKTDFPMVTITAALPGADPETVEKRVTDPIEEAVGTISGLKSLNSTSADSFSILQAEFQLDKDVDIAYQEIQANLSAIRASLPADLEEPVIQKMDIDAGPIVTVAISADLPIRELSHLANNVFKERLLRVPNVGSVRLVGDRERKIWLWLDAEAMIRHGVSVQAVRAALAAAHVNMPAGRLQDDRVEVIARTKAEFTDPAAMMELVVAKGASGVIRLRDVGRIEDGLEERRSHAQFDDLPCIAMQIRRQSGTNVVAVAEGIVSEVERLRAEYRARGLKFEITQDDSVNIRRSVEEVETHLVVGGGMAVLMVLMFLMNWGSTFISSMVLPTSIMASFIIINALGYSLNMITLLALTLAIGLLIDDAIVVQENIMRHIHDGVPPRRAAEEATSEIGLAVFATTMAVVAVFLPASMMGGIIGRFLAPFGVTVSFAVIISMCVSFTLDPMLSSRILRKTDGRNAVFAAFERIFMLMEDRYGRLVRLTLRHRGLVVALGVACMLVALTLIPLLNVEFQPTEDKSEIRVLARAPQGATLSRTLGIAEAIRLRLKDLPEMRHILFTIGADSMEKVNEVALNVMLVDKTQRARSQGAVVEAIRAKLAGLEGAEYSVQAASGGPSDMKSADIQYQIRGADLDVLAEVSNRILARMRAAGFVDLRNSCEVDKPVADVVVDRARAEHLGVSCADIATTLAASVGGANVGKFDAGGDRYDIAIRLLERFRDRPGAIGDLRVPARDGSLVELRNLSRVIVGATPVEITRFNRRRNVTVLANMPRGMALGGAMSMVEKIVGEIGLPEGYAGAWGGMSQSMREDYYSMAETMLIAVIVVYIVLAAQFESLVHPFTILLTLPLAFVGAFAALVLTGMSVNLFTMIAFIFLLGIVTKNAILLIDYANTLRERDGMGRDEAIAAAGPVRLRPILMTSFAMIAGMLPTALGTGAGAEARQPMAVAIIGGLVTSTLLTLVVVPAVYSLLDPLSEWMRKRFFELKPQPDEARADEPANA